MHMPSLRDTFAWLHIIVQAIAFNNRDSFEMLREYTSRQQRSHTSTNHDSMMIVESILFQHMLFSCDSRHKLAAAATNDFLRNSL